MDTSNLPKIEFHWKRPTSVKFPSVWHRFETKPKNGKTYKIRIEEVTPDRYDEVLEFMTKFYFNDEPLCSYTKVLEDEFSLKLYKHELTKVLEHGISIIAVLDEDVPKPQIVGLQFLVIVSKSDPPVPEVPGDVMKAYRKLANHILSTTNPYNMVKDDVFLYTRGLGVHPDFRGMNVGYNILDSLEKVCKAFGIRGAFIIFTALQPPILADRLGFKVYFEVVYDDYKDEDGNVIFSITTGHKSLKFMGIMYDK